MLSIRDYLRIRNYLVCRAVADAAAHAAVIGGLVTVPAVCACGLAVTALDLFVTRTCTGRAPAYALDCALCARSNEQSVVHRMLRSAALHGAGSCHQPGRGLYSSLALRVLISLEILAFKLAKAFFLVTLWRDGRVAIAAIAAGLIGSLAAERLAFKALQLRQLFSRADAERLSVCSWRYERLRWRAWFEGGALDEALRAFERDNKIYKTYPLAGCALSACPLLFYELQERFATPYDHEKLQFAMSLEFITEIYLINVPLAFFAADSLIQFGSPAYCAMLIFTVQHSLAAFVLHLYSRSRLLHKTS